MKTFKNRQEFAQFLKENPDPLGVQKNGGYKEYTMEEVAKHNAPPSVWSVYNGSVYDITMYINVHPGGKKILEKVFGKDMSAMFNKFHGYTKIDNIIGPLKIGYISKQKSNFNIPQNENPIGEADEDENED
jgi:cytochrome b involved in lipid metabolism